MTGAYRPAFYATTTGTGGLRDWLAVLHPPYTAWHLSYVAIGAALAPGFALWRLGGTLLAFFLAVGVGAHALDELHGRPLRTGIPAPVLVAAATVSVAAPVAVGWWYGGPRLLPFMVVGAVLVVGYNLEALRGVLHNTTTFALAWGAFPVIVGYYAQHFQLRPPVVLAAAGAVLLSVAQRRLSTPVRTLRRHAIRVDARITFADGRTVDLDRSSLTAPAESALRATSGAVVCLAAALVMLRA